MSRERVCMCVRMCVCVRACRLLASNQRCAELALIHAKFRAVLFVAVCNNVCRSHRFQNNRKQKELSVSARQPLVTCRNSLLIKTVNPYKSKGVIIIYFTFDYLFREVLQNI
jgi:hypothetical protein